MTILIDRRREAVKPTRLATGCLSGLSINVSNEEDKNEGNKYLIYNNGDEQRYKNRLKYRWR
jgi:hypothetical protein